MRYSPVELRHVRLGRALFGYKRDETDKVLEEVADSFEEVWRERGELADRLEDLEKVLADVKQREALLASTLVSAERAAADAKEAAKREAELIVAEAHQEARSIVRTAQSERERLFVEARRVEVLLRSALGMVEEVHAHGADGEASEGAEPTPLHPWPRREDTREFEAIAALPPGAEEEIRHEDEDGGEHPARDFAWG
ncbi:MAG TPA: DivIVA domain-containing protein [Gaiellaceae bacterium]|nr:DivIVA domain-containing protein [Gaiellaceae bacterium]